MKKINVNYTKFQNEDVKRKEEINNFSYVSFGAGRMRVTQ